MIIKDNIYNFRKIINLKKLELTRKTNEDFYKKAEIL